MKSEIFRFLKQYDSNPVRIDRLIVSAFIKFNKLTVKKNKFLKNYIIIDGKEYESLIQFVEFFEKSLDDKFNFEDLIELFEFVISPADKEVNGAIYTPKYIREYILKEIFISISHNNYTKKLPLIADIACGCGGFLFDIAKSIHENTRVSFERIFNECIYGLDIQEYSITRTKLILCLLSLSEGEDKEIFNFNLHVGNSLNFDWKKADNKILLNGGFDAIVGNPPYVGSSKIDTLSKSMLVNWSVTKSGKADLYIPFFQIGLENLTDNGVLGYITVNTFYKSANGRALRDYFSKNLFGFKLVDFAGEQVFKDRSTYTCICIIRKNKANTLEYIESNSHEIKTLKSNNFISFSYQELDNYEGWILKPRSIIKKIKQIESTGTPLGKLVEIRNGFATLKNEIYVFKPIKDEGNLYLLKTASGDEYWIEKGICVDTIKPNILKSEKDVKLHKEKLIFPYKIQKSKDTFGKETSKIELFKPGFLKNQYPLTYKYLSDQKKILLTRDKGEQDYETWYAFGRNQALTIKGYKLLFPYLANKPYFIFTNDQDLLFYNGYALVANTEKELLIYQKILTSDVFWFYIKNYSKPYNTIYYSLAKNYIKKFGICNLSKSEKKWLINCDDGNKINDFLMTKYGLKKL